MAEPSGQTTSASDGTKKRKSRFGRWFLALLVLVLLVVGAAPWIASQPPVTNWLVSQVNAAIPGKMAVENLSLSWMGDIQATNLSIHDPEDVEVVAVDQVVYGGGVIKAVSDRLRFGELRIESPRVVLKLDKDNNLSLVRAFTEPTAEAQPSQGPLPNPQGKIRISNGTIVVMRDDVGKYVIDNLQSDLTIATLNELAGTITADLQEGSKLSADLDVQDLFTDGKFDMANASGKVKLATEAPAEIGPLAAVLAGRKGATGQADINVDMELIKNDANGAFDIEVANLRVPSESAAKLKPVNAKAAGKLTMKDGLLDLDANLNGDMGRADVSAQLPSDLQMPNLAGDQLMAAITEGKELNLPEAKISATADIDLAALNTAIPGLLPLQEGQKLTSGKLVLRKLNAVGGATPTVEADLNISDLTAKQGDEVTRVSPMTLSVEARIESGDGLKIDKGDVQAEFATVNATGSMSQLKADLRADLSRLQNELGQVIDFGDVQLAGTVNGSVELARPNDDQLDTKAKLEVVKGKYRSGETKFEVADAAFEQEGRLLLKDGELQRIEADRLMVDLRDTGKIAAGGTYIMANQALNADADVSGDIGNAKIKIDLPKGFAMPATTAEKVMTAILSGEESLTLPEATVEASGNVDLAALDKAFPGMVAAEGNQKLVSGTVAIQQLRLSGGEAPKLTTQLTLENLSTRSGEETTTVESVAVDLDGEMQQGKGLFLKTGTVKAPFATIDAGGYASDLKANVKADLQRLQRDLGSIIDFGDMQLGGQVSGTVELARAGDERIDTKIDMTATQARYQSGETNLDIPRAKLTQVGQIQLKDNAVTRIEAQDLTADFEGSLVAKAKGHYGVDKGGFGADIQLDQADVGYVAAYLKAFGVEGLDGYRGMIVGKASASRAAPDAPITAAANLIGRGLKYRDKPLFDQDVTVEGREVVIDTAGEKLQLASASVNAPNIKLLVDGLRMDLATSAVNQGKVNADADVQQVLRVVAIVSEMEETPNIKGRLTLDTAVTAAKAGMHLKGTGRIAKLEIPAGEQTVREDKVDLVLDARFDTEKQLITLGDNRITSKPLTANVKGTIADYDTVVRADLSGDYNASLAELTAMLHEFVPATKGLIAFNGESASAFSLKGPLAQEDVSPGFRGATGNIDFGWGSADVLGIPLGKKMLEPTLKNGQVNIPLAVFSAGDGKMRLMGEVDFKPADTTFRLPGPHTLLADIKITPELSKELLSRINPIFFHVTEAEGTVHLTTKDIVMPFGETMETASTGRGKLDLEDAAIRPAGMVTDLLVMGNVMNDRGLTDVQLTGGDFIIKNGRISYDNFTMIFAKAFDLIFSGSVGFDDTLDLVVSIPIRPEVLRQFGVSGPVGEYAELLSGTRIKVPIVGTRENPKLDKSAVDTDSLIKGIAEGATKKATEEVGKEAGRLLQGLLGGDKKEKK